MNASGPPDVNYLPRDEYARTIEAADRAAEIAADAAWEDDEWS